MKPLYLSSPVREGLGPWLRPGGALLTKRILGLVAPTPNSIVLDAGCGLGASMTLFKEYGVQRILGFDINPKFASLAALRENIDVALADLAQLPLPDGCLDLVLCECVWNLTNRQQVTAEFARVLRPGGCIALSDIHSRTGIQGIWPIPCCFSQATHLTAVADIFTGAGFTIEILEDHTPLLNRTTAEFVFAHGSLQGFWQAVTGDAALATAACSAAAASRPGLFLLLARRNDKYERK